MLDAGLERKIVQKSGSYFSFDDERLGQGRQNATAFLREHPDVTQAILAAASRRSRRRSRSSRRGCCRPGAPEQHGGERSKRPKRSSRRHDAAVAPRITALRPAGDGARRRRARRRALADGCPLEAVVARRPRGRARARPAAGAALRRELRRAEALDGGGRALAPARPARAGARGAGSSGEASRPAERRETVERLERAGVVDDARFARARAAALAARGRGDAAIRYDLERAGRRARGSRPPRSRSSSRRRSARERLARAARRRARGRRACSRGAGSATDAIEAAVPDARCGARQ